VPRIVRLLDTNLLKAAGVVLSASSAYASLPVRFLLDQLRSKPWRSALGWTVIAGAKDELAFIRGGNLVATILPGYYATGTEYAAAVVAALELADATPAWVCTYDSTTHKFTISSDLAFTLRTSLDQFVDVWKDMGYAVGSDTSSATTHTADNAVYQGAHWITADLGSAQQANATFLLDTNVSASGTVVLGSSATSIALAVAAPDQTVPLVGSGDLILEYGVGTLRYHAIIIEDQGNSDGFAEVGIAFLGTYRQPSVSYSNDTGEEGDDLSEGEQATEGAIFADLRPEENAWTIDFQDIPEADADLLRAHREATPKFKCFGLAFDADVDNTDFLYGYRATALPIKPSTAIYFHASFLFREALP